VPKSQQATLNDTVDIFRTSLRRLATHPTISGYRPLPMQKKFHESKAKGKVYLGGNRAGKTVGGATETVLKMLGQHPNQTKQPPLALRAIGSSFEDGIKKIIIPEIQKWLPPSSLKKGSWESSYDLSARTLSLENGSTLEFLTYDQDVQKHAGTSRDGVWFDEEPPEDIFNENMLRLVDVGGDWWLTMTPLIDMSWTYSRLYEVGIKGDNPGIEIFHADTLDNTYIDPTVLDTLLEGMSDEEKDARKHGTYYNLSGGIFTEFMSKNNFIDPIVNSELWPLYYHKWGHFGMLDHGLKNPTAFHLGAYDENGNVVIYYEYEAKGKLVRENAESIKAIIASLQLEQKLDYIVADPSIRNTEPINGSSVYNEYAENGLYMVLGNNDVKASISRVNAKFKDLSLLITTDNPHLMKELPMYRWAKFVSSKVAMRKNPQEQPVKVNDHHIDSLRYGIMSRPQFLTDPDKPVGNIINAPVALKQERYDVSLMKPYNTWDHPGIFDEILGDDW
jgi:phage terminase large subunit-like protein